MMMFCGKCGNQIAQNDKFCAICGTKIENIIDTEIDPNKKVLTDEIIKKELLEQKYGIAVYILAIVLLGWGIFTVFYLGGIFTIISSLFAFALLIMIIIMIKNDRKCNRANYYVLDRPCVKKTIKDNDNNREYRLWFENRNGQLITAIDVKEEIYYAARIDEEFYVVFLESERTPRLCYKKNEWTIKDIGLCQ